MCRNFHVIKGPRGVHYIYTPAGCKSTVMQAFFCVCVGSVEGEEGDFLIHEILIAELYSFSPPSKLTLITVSGRVS